MEVTPCDPQGSCGRLLSRGCSETPKGPSGRLGEELRPFAWHQPASPSDKDPWKGPSNSWQCLSATSGDTLNLNHATQLLPFWGEGAGDGTQDLTNKHSTELQPHPRFQILDKRKL
jgi:hypothetical protein